VERATYAAVAGLAAVAMPASLYWTIDWADDSILIAWFVGPFLGPLVFQLISRRRPEWWMGLAFGAFLGVALGIWGGIDTPFEEIEGGQAAIIGAMIFAATFLAGMVGASAASLVGRAFDYYAEQRGVDIGRFRPWHVGVDLLAAEIVVVAAIVAAD
jgi:hypothetical protein